MAKSNKPSSVTKGSIAAKEKGTAEAKRKYLSQTDVPSYTLEAALKIPRAIADEYASAPTRPLAVAKALSLNPTTASFRQRCGAAIAYGLTAGGYNASQVTLLPLAKRILSPVVEGDDVTAKKEAFLKPRVIGLFLTKYDGAKLPRRDIAENVLQEMGVPKDAVKRTYELIVSNASSLGLLTEINGASYVNLQGGKQVPVEVMDQSAAEKPPQTATDGRTDLPKTITPPIQTAPGSSRNDFRKKRVFVTHGKEKGFLEPIKKLLGFGELEPVISIERQTVSLSVPEKVMSDMRSCGAAIIHVDAELRLVDGEAKEHIVLNSNVLIEIGAAMALYGKRFILLVRDGVKLPSNLQGLYEVRYSGDQLDGNATIKLLESINDIKNHALPD